MAYLRRHALTWVEDETNADLRFARNHLRHVVMPALASLNPNIVGTLARTAGLLADEAQRTEEADAATLRQLLVEPTAAERIVLDHVRWQQQPLAARRGVLRLALNQLVPHARQIGYEHIDRILQSAAPGKSSGPHPLPEGLAWTVVGATAVQAARLCLHAASATPLAIDHPFLDAAWRAEHTECPVPVPGELTAGAWRLITTRLSAAELPAAWPATHIAVEAVCECRGTAPTGPYHAPAGTAYCAVRHGWRASQGRGRAQQP